MTAKNCFIDKTRPCDLTCKAAFPVDDANDPVDCYFIWLASHVGEGALDFRKVIERQIQRPGPLGPAGPGSDDGPKSGGGPPGFSPN